MTSVGASSHLIVDKHRPVSSFHFNIHLTFQHNYFSSGTCATGREAGGFFQTWDHSENHPSLNPPPCSRKMTGLACHWPAIWICIILLRPGTSTTYNVYSSHFSYIKSSMKNIRIKARKKTLDCHHLPIRRMDSWEIQCPYPCWKWPCTTNFLKSLKRKLFKTSGPSVIGFLN